MWPPATVVPAHTKVLVPYARATDKLTRALTTSRLIGAAIGILMSALADEVTPTGALPSRRPA